MEPKFIEANGLRFGYLEAGTGPLVLLLHGFPDTAYTWDQIQPAIANAGYRVVAPFMRGYHPTAIPADGKYDAETLAKDVIGLIDAFGEKQAIVIGHDWGAVAAYAAAGAAPERVKLLVTFAVPHPRSLKPTPRLVWRIRHFITMRRKNPTAAVSANDFAYVDELVSRWSPAWKVPAGETDRVKAVFRQPGTIQAAAGYYRQQTIRPAPPHKADIKVPTVAFAGETDIIVPRAYEKARHIFKASYEVVQMPGGHFMHREHPDHAITELVRVITDTRS